MYPFHQLPQNFAVLRPTSGGSPSYQLCQRSLSFHPNGNEPNSQILEFAKVTNIDLPPERQNQCVRLDTVSANTIYFTRVRNEEQNDHDIRQIKWWYLPHELRWEDTMDPIPIIDSNKRFYLTRVFHRVIPVNVTSAEMSRTVNQYASLDRQFRERINNSMYRPALPEIPRRTRSPLWESFRTPIRRRPEPPPLPSFVIELLVKDACEAKKTCPITMLPFSDLSSIGVTSCFHLFDFDSLQKWKEEHGTCPLCRTSLQTIFTWQRPSSHT